MQKNPLGVRGIEFLEYSGNQNGNFEKLFAQLGISKIAEHKNRARHLYSQHDINFIINSETGTFAEDFSKKHGPSISAMAWRVDDAEFAFSEAQKRGAKAFQGKDQNCSHEPLPAIYGIGDSLIYFIDNYTNKEWRSQTFQPISNNVEKKPPALLRIDHLTNNVPKGEMNQWCDFYADIFGFEEVRYFDIKGKKTGLFSKVMCLEDRSIMIPINEPSDGKSQIQEYLDEYHGSGIQHVALSTANIIDTVSSMRGRGLEFLDTPDTYFGMIRDRLPNLEENVENLRPLKILADGDKEGYLLQIFSKNVIGPIFYEIIQRKNHWGFGEGNFQALFDAIERDQMARGYIK